MRKSMAFEKLFLCLWIPLSLLMMAVTPITRTPDEPAHLQQAFVIADGQLISSLTEKTVYLPDNLLPANAGQDFSYDDLRELLHQHLSSSQRAEAIPTATAIYPPFSYFPQALGMALCMLLTDNLFAILYAARLMNWLCITLVLYGAAKLLPYSKRLFALVMLLPMNVQQMISASADGMAIALVALLTAFVLHCVTHRPAFTWKHYAVTLGLGLTLWCFKMFYAPMIFLLCFIPAECFGQQKKKRLWATGVIGGGILLMCGWILLCYMTMFQQAEEGLTGQTMANITNFLQNPADFAVKLIPALLENGLGYISGIFGYRTALSWLNIGPGLPLTLASMLLLVLAFLLDDGGKPGRAFRINGLLLPLVCLLIVFFMLYFWWTPGDSPRIEGFQARYMLPLLFTMAMACKAAPKRQVKHQWLLLAGAAAINLGYLYQIAIQI